MPCRRRRWYWLVPHVSWKSRDIKKLNAFPCKITIMKLSEICHKFVCQQYYYNSSKGGPKKSEKPTEPWFSVVDQFIKLNHKFSLRSKKTLAAKLVAV